MIILGIETSCDETAASVVEDGHSIRSNIVSSQIDKHACYGGVVPELAAREHLIAINPVVEFALKEANVNFTDLNAVAVTHTPGLLPALLVGVSYAKGLAAGLNIPLQGVNHFLAHIYAAFIDRPGLLRDSDTFPIVSLVVSGGNTALTLINQDGNFQVLGRTIDDAAGEAFDKAAKILNLSYPGGPIIDELSKKGNPQKFKFPQGLMGENGKKLKKSNRLNFSFSGVKTSLLYHAFKHQLVSNNEGVGPFNNSKPKMHRGKNQHLSKMPPLDQRDLKNSEGRISPDNQEGKLEDTAASFQEAIVSALVRKSLLAVNDHDAKTLVICGGVACNSRLRTKLREEKNLAVKNMIIVPPHLCTDNAAMIAGLAYHSLLKETKEEGLNLDAQPQLSEIHSVPFCQG